MTERKRVRIHLFYFLRGKISHFVFTWFYVIVTQEKNREILHFTPENKRKITHGFYFLNTFLLNFFFDNKKWIGRIFYIFLVKKDIKNLILFCFYLLFFSLCLVNMSLIFCLFTYISFRNLLDFYLDFYFVFFAEKLMRFMELEHWKTGVHYSENWLALENFA